MAAAPGVLRGKENNLISEPRDSDISLPLPTPWTKQISQIDHNIFFLLSLESFTIQLSTQY